MNPMTKRSLSKAWLIFALVLFVHHCADKKSVRYFCKPERFSIEFPASWKVMQHYKGARIMAIAPQGRECSYIRENINVVVEKVTRPTALDEYVDLQVQILKRLKGITVLERSKTVIAGRRAVRFSYLYAIKDFGYRAIVYTLQRNCSFYVITGISQINNYKNVEKIFHDSAASFRLE